MATSCHCLLRYNTTREEVDGKKLLLSPKKKGNCNKLSSPSLLEHHHRRKQHIVIIFFFFSNTKKKVISFRHFLCATRPQKKMTAHCHCLHLLKHREKGDNYKLLSLFMLQQHHKKSQWRIAIIFVFFSNIKQKVTTIVVVTFVAKTPPQNKTKHARK